MKIGLLDIDGHNFPNLALMKISAYHKIKGDEVEFADMFSHYDFIYKSKVFTWTPDNNVCYDTDAILKGGSGYQDFIELPKEYNICPDYDLYNCQHAYGFLTRGCIRNCEWCIVPKKEGKIRAENDIQDFIGNKKSAILMDNNILACEYGIKQIEKIGKRGYKIDFNQGLDARLIDDSIAKLLSKIKWLSPVRLACDSDKMIAIVEKAVERLRKFNVTPKRYFIYMLVTDDIENAKERAEYLNYLQCDPFAQAYRDFNNNEPTKLQRDFCRWVNHKAIFKTVEWENYNNGLRSNKQLVKSTGK